jgi:hypothetical protein
MFGAVAPRSGPIEGDPTTYVLFVDDPPGYGTGRAELRAIRTLEAMHAARPFTDAQQLLAEVARSLAQNIDGGNLKGRAIGNEALQLTACITQIAGDDDDSSNPDNLPPDARKLLDALASPAR